MTCIFTGTDCLLHLAGSDYPERPERLENILAGLREDGYQVTESPRHEQAEASVIAVHDRRYIRRFEAAVTRGDGLLDSADNPLSPGSWKAAWAAVSAVLDAADAVASEAGKTAFAAVRPPGHHAEHALAMGFCFFNNAAVAAEYLIRHHGFDRVAIFDFDVHHGNGTQHLFEDRSDVLYASLHQAPFYPGTGGADERGVGRGEGATINVPLPAGTGDEAFLAAVDEQILPVLERFEPQVLIASAGFDAWSGDPLGGFKVSLEGFAALGHRLAQFAQGRCQGRLLSVLEGGYDLPSLSELVGAYLGVETSNEA